MAINSISVSTCLLPVFIPSKCICTPTASFDLRLVSVVISVQSSAEQLNPNSQFSRYFEKSKISGFKFPVKYSDEISTLANRYMHLTNYSINKLSNNYAANEDAEACVGHKWYVRGPLWVMLTFHFWSKPEPSYFSVIWSLLNEFRLR